MTEALIDTLALLESLGILHRRRLSMDKDRPNFFSGPYMDRRSEAREAPDWLEAALADEQTLFVLGRGTTQLLRKEPRPAINFVSRSHPAVRAADPGSFVLLGWFRGARCVFDAAEY